MNSQRQSQFASRAGLKLDHALSEFDLDVAGFICADFGCNVGGFTDCLLKRGAANVYAIDTGYGTLAYKLRIDDRVVVMERTNALHTEPPSPFAGCDLVVIDMGWTQQRHAIPAALKWLKPDGRIVSLIKPHYELDKDEKRLLLKSGNLAETDAQRVLIHVLERMPSMGVEPISYTKSPITGGKSSRKGAGNVEYLVLARPNEP